MSDGTSIEWAHATWTIAVGCTRVSPGCNACYAATFVHRGLHSTHRGLTKLRSRSSKRPGVDWNGKVRTLPERLADPLRWRKPRRVFVGSITDLFHPRIKFEYIAAVFGVMAATPRHTYLVLTKRPERARKFFTWLEEEAKAEHPGLGRDGIVCLCCDLAQRFTALHRGSDIPLTWPLPNVHLGVSIEDQKYADERIPELLECPAALHWISAEPLLGPVDLAEYLPEQATLGYVGPELRAKGYTEGPILLRRGAKLGHVIIGGESGQGARPFNVAWARDVIRQCRGVGTRVFVKQIGRLPHNNTSLDLGDGYRVQDMRDRKGGDMSEWPLDLRVREVP